MATPEACVEEAASASPSDTPATAGLTDSSADDPRGSRRRSSRMCRETLLPGRRSQPAFHDEVEVPVLRLTGIVVQSGNLQAMERHDTGRRFAPRRLAPPTKSIGVAG